MSGELEAKVEELRRARAAQAEAEVKRLAGLSPATQDLISKMENNHMTLADFQRREGLEPDGIMGPLTMARIKELEYQRKKNSAAIESAMDIRRPKEFKQARRGCTARVVIHAQDGTTRELVCDKGQIYGDNHDGPHFAGWGKTRVRWESRKAYFRQESNGSLRATTANAIQIYDPARTEVTHVEGHQMPDPYATYEDYKRGTVVLQTTWPSDKDLARIRRGKPPVEKLTREMYRKRFSEMEYKVVRAKRFGFSVIVLLARGGSWLYWRPTRAWAESTGAKRLKRELRRLDLMYERDNPGDGIKAKDLGIHFQMTTEELTLELARRGTEDKKNEMAEWDAAFHEGQEEAS